MTSLIPRETVRPNAVSLARASDARRPSRLLSGIYHDIGMAAVANGLNLSLDSLDHEAHESVKRGARYIFLMPRRTDASQAAE